MKNIASVSKNPNPAPALKIFLPLASPLLAGGVAANAADVGNGHGTAVGVLRTRPSTFLTTVLMVLSAALSLRAQQLPASGSAQPPVANVAHLAQSDLDRALESARSGWGIFTPVEIQVGTIDPCVRGSNATLAITQLFTETTTTTSDDPEVPAVTVEKTFSIIRFNGNCKWNDQLLDDVMRHEYGHALGLGHSKSKDSIMNPVVERQVTLEGITLGLKRKLSIMDEDRAAALKLQKKPSDSIATRACGGKERTSAIDCQSASLGALALLHQ